MTDDTLRQHRLNSYPCPWCNHVMDAATHIGATRGPPKAGDAALCIKCARASIFMCSAVGVWLRKPTPEEADEPARMPLLAKGKAAIIRASRHPQTGWDLPQ